MALHLLSAERLSKRLSSGEVSPKEQAYYLMASLVLWLVPGYLLIAPAPNVQAWSIPFGLWFYEAGALVLINVFGVLYCLAKCTVEPKKNFLVDFSCLYAPTSLTTLVVVWGVFHIYASLIPLWVQTLSFDSPPPLLDFMYSARFFDLMRFLAIVGSTFLVMIRIGHYMGRVSQLRLSAHPTAIPDAQKSAARGSP
jgi:hypothetical protein